MTPSTTTVCVGVDVGSTNTKAVALGPGGEVLARSAATTPRRADGCIDGTELLDMVERLVLACLGRELRLQAVAVAGVGEDGVLESADGAALHPALPWFDPRRGRELEVGGVALAGVAEDRRAGLELDPARTVLAWSWHRRHTPGLLERAARWQSLTDLPVAHWCRRPFLTDTLAARTAAWDVAARDWLPRRVRATLGGRRLLPEVLPGGVVVGPLRSDRLAPVLAPGAVGVSGGHDHPVAGWAVHRAWPGAVLDSMGTAEVITRQLPSGTSSAPPGFDLSPGIGGPGSTLLSVLELARNLSWAGQDVPGLAAALDHALADPALRPDLTAAAVLQLGRAGGGAPAWTSQHRSGCSLDELARAVLVDAARAPVARLHSLLATADPPRPGSAAPRVVMAGGWVRSPGWVMTKTAVLAAEGLEATTLAEPELGAIGAALLAAAAVGWASPARTALGVPG